MNLVDMYQSATLLVPQWHTMQVDPPAPAPQTGWRTATLATLAVGPIALQAGDIIDARLDHEFDSEAPGAGYWTINGQQSEHWTRWTMASTAVRVGPAVDPNAGAYVIQPKETNWDWYIHHLAISRSGLYKVPAAIPAAYIYDRVYFKSGMSYTNPAYRDVQINGAPYPLLQVALYR